MYPDFGLGVSTSFSSQSTHKGREDRDRRGQARPETVRTPLQSLVKRYLGYSTVHF